MREIGGYLGLDTYMQPVLHEKAVALNCGRNALAYLIRTRNIKSLLLPKFLCDSISHICEREGISVRYYRINNQFLLDDSVELKENEWLFLVNYYGQLSNAVISSYVNRYKHVIVDQAHSYFQLPLAGVDMMYVCRKYFGVADGAFLYTTEQTEQDFPLDQSFDRMRFLLGRYERSAAEFYSEYTLNNQRFAVEPIKRMSLLTRNLLHGIDYERVYARRTENYRYLQNQLGKINELKLTTEEGTFMYPFKVPNGDRLRKQLQREKIYVPTLWPCVFRICSKEDIEYQMARDILPLPIDQRYDLNDMEYMTNKIFESMNSKYDPQ